MNKNVADSKYKALQYIDYVARKEQLTNPVQCSGEITPNSDIRRHNSD